MSIVPSPAASSLVRLPRERSRGPAGNGPVPIAGVAAHQPRDASFPWRVGVVLLVLAFVIRGWQFGNPLIHVDENFYLLVGDRMLRGEVPFVDVWDRKPIGLFLLYAAIRLLGGVGIIQYQVVATLFVAATAFVIVLIGRRIATTPAAMVAAILYMLLLGLTGGMGGQAPVFYNLPVAVAALCVLRAWTEAAGDLRAVRRLGAVAMALIGVALQLKYTAVFEGAFLGLALLVLAVQTRPLPLPLPGAYAGTIALWVGLAAAPSLMALGWYAAIGHFDAFLYANFFSIAGRSGDGGAELLRRLGKTGKVLILPAVAAILAGRLGEWRANRAGTQAFTFAVAWLAVALAGYAVFGSYFDHYALPLLPPLCVVCAPLFAVRRHRLGPIAAAIMLGAGTIAYAVAVGRNPAGSGAAAVERLLAAIGPRTTGLFVYDGDPILYLLTGTMPPTRYVFPSHLHLRREAGAIGVDPLAELRAILATRPDVVVDTIQRSERLENPAANALVRAELRRAYRPIAWVTRNRQTTIVFERLPVGPERRDTTSEDQRAAAGGHATLVGHPLPTPW